MKLSKLAYAAAGYVLGARAGRERYDQIVSVARRVGGSQTVQASAGVLQGQLDQLATHARRVFAGKIAGSSSSADAGNNGVNGYHS